jgi:hypothetical protein
MPFAVRFGFFTSPPVHKSILTTLPALALLLCLRGQGTGDRHHNQSVVVGPVQEKHANGSIFSRVSNETGIVNSDKKLFTEGDS